MPYVAAIGADLLAPCTCLTPAGKEEDFRELSDA